MIEKTLVLFAGLVLLLGLASAASENGFSITVVGAGESTSNRISGNSGNTVFFNVQFNNSNSSYQSQTLNLSLSGTNIVQMNKTVSGNESFQVSFVIPSTQATQSRTLSAEVYSSDILLGTPTDSVYYTVNNANTSLPGCTDSSAINYNSSATVDDGSCIYNEDNDFTCEFGETGDLEIVAFDITNLGNGDEEEWNLLDSIEIEIEIENNNRNENVDDVIVELRILDEGNNDVTSDFDLDEEEIDIGRIKEKDSKFALFKILELPADLEESNYKIYVKAYSENDEETQCVDSSSDFNEDNFHEIEIIREDDPAVFAESDLLKILGTCGEQNIIANFDIYNLGSDDEDSVLVVLENSELGISESQVISDLKTGKKKEITFTFNLPDQLSKNVYDLLVRTYYDYNDGDEREITSYDETSEDIDRDFNLRLEVLSCQSPEPTINAKLNSEAKVGDDLIISVTIKNNADEEKNFVISTSEFESWAELKEIDPSLLTIGAGESAEVLISLLPNSEGVKSFKIKAVSDGQTSEQPVSVIISKGSGLFSGIDNLSLYLLIGIGVLIVLILIVLIIKVTRKTKESY
ncbi:MAG: putative S-layer protein [Candidatus Pacearchaeota archaeon]